MLDLNRNKYINGLCAIAFLLALSMFVVGALNYNAQNVVLGLGLMCITFPSLVRLVKKLKQDGNALFTELEAKLYDRLSLAGLILLIIGIVFLQKDAV